MYYELFVSLDFYRFPLDISAIPSFFLQVIYNRRCGFRLRDTRHASLAAREFRFAIIVDEGVPCQVALSST
jgi:hypothetical protein